MLQIALALSFTLAVAGCASPPRVAASPLADQLARVAGAGAADCGTYDTPRPSMGALHCALAQDTQGKAFRLAYHPQGIDSEVWHAVGRDGQGRAFVLVHDSNPGGGPGWDPAVTLRYCDYGVDWTTYGQSPVGCREPLTGSPLLPVLMSPPPGLEEVYLTGSMGGVLVVDRDCVRLRDDQSRLTTVLWHAGVQLGRDRTGYFLQQGQTGPVHRFGERLDFGGGGMPAAQVLAQYPEVARRCGPPYASGWLPDRPATE